MATRSGRFHLRAPERCPQAKKQGGTVWTFACAFVLCWQLSCRGDAVARAQDGPELALSWHADPGCPDRAWAEARLRDRLGRPLLRHAATTLEVSARLSRSGGGGFTLELGSTRSDRTSGRVVRGVRTLSDPRCQEVAQAAVLVIALALEDQQEQGAAAPPVGASGAFGAPPGAANVGPASGKQPAAEPAKPTDPTERNALSPPSHVPKATAPAARSISFVALRAAGLVEFGFLPQPGVGPDLGLSLAGERLRVELDAFWMPWRTSGPAETGRVSVMLWALRPAGCAKFWRSRTGRFEFDACLGLEIGRARSRGKDLSERREPDWLYRAGWACLRLTTKLGARWGLLLEPGASVPLGRPRYVSETTENGSPTALHTPSAVAARITLGLERRF